MYRKKKTKKVFHVLASRNSTSKPNIVFFLLSFMSNPGSLRGGLEKKLFQEEEKIEGEYNDIIILLSV